jgi:hypothetical protein
MRFGPRLLSNDASRVLALADRKAATAVAREALALAEKDGDRALAVATLTLAAMLGPVRPRRSSRR